MSHASPEEIKSFVTLQNKKWNEHDRAGYIKAWKSMAPNGITFEDPVGTPPKVGWEPVVIDVGHVQSDQP